MTALAVIFAALAFHGAAYPLTHAERVASIPIVCVHNLNWEGRKAGGLYFSNPRLVAINDYSCQDLIHWRSLVRWGASITLRDEIWQVGHELSHDDQFMTGRPFDEHEADCGGIAKFQRVRSALGITVKLRPPKIADC